MNNIEWLHAEIGKYTTSLEYCTKELKENPDSIIALNYVRAYTLHVQYLRDILNELKAYKGLKTPMTVNVMADGYADGYPVYDTATCPNCGRVFELCYEEEYKYCPDCGQRLGWK